MENIQEYNNSILYCKNNKLIEYNLLTKRRYLHYIPVDGMVILDYFMVKGNKVISIYNRNTCRHFDRHDKIQIIWNNKIIAKNIDLGDIYRMQVENNIYVLLSIRGRCGTQYCLYDIDGLIASRKLSEKNLDISSDGRWIILSDYVTDCSYVKLIDDINLLSLFDFTYHLNRSDHIDGYAFYIRWLSNSTNFIIIDGCVINVYTYNKLKIVKKCNVLDIDDFLIQSQPNSINIYDVNSLNLRSTINCNLYFVTYHRKLKIMITKNMEYYRIDSHCNLNKITMGKNYLRDRNIVPNCIMDCILEKYLVFESLPLEIKCVELYQEILIMQ